MTGITTWRRRAVIGAVVALGALTLVACSKDQSGTPAPGGSQPGDGALGAAPTTRPASGTSTTATNEGGGGGTGGGGGGGGSNSPVYPKDAKSYAQELLKAWGQLDYNRISQLAVQAGVQQIKDSVNSGGNPNSNWSYLRCRSGSTSGQTACVFHNSNGDESTIVLNNTQLGFPTAVLEAQLDRTVYPSDPVSYVSAMFTAFQNGNSQRVLRLSNSDVKSSLSCILQATSTSVTPADSGKVTVRLEGLGGDLGKAYAFTVLASPGGKPNAVQAVTTKTC